METQSKNKISNKVDGGGGGGGGGGGVVFEISQKREGGSELSHKKGGF